MLCAIGFSVRALCYAVRKAGLGVLAVDHFSDQDTQELAAESLSIPWPPSCTNPVAILASSTSKRLLSTADDAKTPAEVRKKRTAQQATPGDDLTRFPPEQLSNLARQLKTWRNRFGIPDLPILAAGGIENHPEVIHVLQNTGEFLGPTPKQLRRLRDPATLSDLGGRSGLQVPTTITTTDQLDLLTHPRPIAHGWIRKPYRSGGGVGISPLTQPFTEALGSRSYLQRFIPGRSIGISIVILPSQSSYFYTDNRATHFFGSSDVTNCATHHLDDPAQPGRPVGCPIEQDGVVLLGATASWSEEEWPAPKRFLYRGSWGPIPLKQAQIQSLFALGCLLRQEFDYVGWMGVDCILDAHGQLWLLELNPRWTAGMEVLLMGRINPVCWHLLALGRESLLAGGSKSEQPPNRRSRLTSAYPAVSPVAAAKAIIYAPRDLELTRDQWAAMFDDRRAEVRDVPAWPAHRQTLRIPGGSPVCTVTAQITADQVTGTRTGKRLSHRRERQGVGNPAIAIGCDSADEVRARLLQRLQSLSEKILSVAMNGR